MPGALEGKTAVVTGAGGGIGRATALLFAREGGKVVASDVDDAIGRETVAEVEAAGGTATYLHCDVSQEKEVAALIDGAEKAYGGFSVLVNNAGVEGPVCGLLDYDVEAFDRLTAINLRGVFLGLKHGGAALRRAGQGGSIVNLASVAGLVGAAMIAPYVMSKHGVIGLTKSAALEFAPDGVRVNAVCPGVIKTRMADELVAGLGGEEAEGSLTAAHPLGRFGAPSEIAELILWLASDRSSFSTGGHYTSDGGFTAQ